MVKSYTYTFARKYTFAQNRFNANKLNFSNIQIGFALYDSSTKYDVKYDQIKFGYSH